MAQYPSSAAGDSHLYIAVNNLETLLVGALGASGGNNGADIEVSATTGFPTSGFITIGNEAIAYTSLLAGPPRFSGITRGADGTTAVAHSDGSRVKHTQIAAHHNALKEEVKAIETDLLTGNPPLRKSGGTMSGDITMSNQKAIVFKETTGNGTDSVTLKAPASVTTSYTLQLPPAVASAPGQVLTDVNANGVLTWENGVGATVSREDYIVGTPLDNYTGSTTVFNLVAPYTVAGKTLLVTLDGDIQTLGASADYLETNSTTVTFNNALVVGERVSFISSVPAASSSGIVNSGTTGQLAYYASNAATASGTNAGTVGTNGNLIVTGTTTNDNAAAGKIGEFVNSLSGYVNFPTSSLYGDLTSISLTAGDWDISAGLSVSRNGATITVWEVGVSTTSGNDSAGLVRPDSLIDGPIPTGTPDMGAALPTYRLSLASMTTVYLKYTATYTVATPQAKGRISARRVR